MSKTSRKDLSTVVEGVVVVGRRRRRGTFLIALGLLAAAGAVALVVSGRKQAGSPGAPAAEADLPPVERRDALTAEQAAESDVRADDAVGDAERKADEALAGKAQSGKPALPENAQSGKPALPDQPAGKRRGRHAAQE